MIVIIHHTALESTPGVGVSLTDPHSCSTRRYFNHAELKPAVDEMFPEGTGPYVDLDEAGGSTRFLMDLTANEKAVHADFCNEFDDDDIE
ncbi:COP9 signalosome complex subunit 9 [Camelus ferus]|uniref:COP9 signalosome complex subunit 9 n=1 Tax=Camelus ferus TaxID=419612 RepID=A0A8B8SI26_CAMFR|nr:COP9 signalosome complex subunit 9 [Camelus ferus]